MEYITPVLSWLAANPDFVLAVLAGLIPYTTGRVKTWLPIAHDIGELRGKVKDGAIANVLIEKLPTHSSLTLDQARSILIADGDKVVVNKIELVKAVASSGDFKKATRKIGKFFKKVF
mgnify:CR=1 FL=1